MINRTYSPEFKLQVVLEALQSNGTDAEVARADDWESSFIGVKFGAQNWSSKSRSATSSKGAQPLSGQASVGIPVRNAILSKRYLSKR